jgi:UDP-glucose 4-epimerase
VMIWDEDVAGVIAQGLRRGGTGVYNLAGDGTLSMHQIARLLGKRYVALPPWLVRAALAAAKPLRLSRYGPEQVPFLRYRPVLSNRRLKQEFGYRPRKTTREVFETFLAARRRGS